MYKPTFILAAVLTLSGCSVVQKPAETAVPVVKAPQGQVEVIEPTQQVFEPAVPLCDQPLRSLSADLRAVFLQSCIKGKGR
ncbi:hypothetical protein [Magnetococcus sp. PR-3]|uniref:hypothetical protein n=1 Tax=Magnetococcus sp. PR-3 TaxID=3120355 RepID=UPI002FCE64FA